MKNQIWLMLVMALMVAGGCRKPGGQDSEGQGMTYNPEEDPLVNPPRMFEPAPGDRSQIATDETLTICLSGSPNTLNPIFLSSHYEMVAAGVLSAGPFSFDKDMQWMINYDITESFEESEDHTTFTLKLKEGLTWHDGKPFTAHDIVYSWRQILDPCVPCPAVKPGTNEVTSCTALDDHTVQYVQAEPLATRLWNILFPIIPKHIYEKQKQEYPDLKTGPYYNKHNRMPVGNGPYKIVEWKENDRIVVERWEEYPGKKPYFKRVIFQIVPDNNVAFLNFEKGSIDALERLTAEQFAFEAAGSEAFKERGHKGLGTEWTYGYIGWNMDGSNHYFDDKDVRYAMTHALNIPLIMDKVFYNLATKCKGIFHPDSWMYNPEVEPLTYDMEKARSYLDRAGWRVDPDDGWRYKEIEGERVKFEFTLLMPQGSQTSPKIAAIFQEDLKRLGIIMKTQIIEWASFLEKVRKHEFEAEIAAWGTGTDPDTNWNLWRTEEYEIGRNYGGYSNERVDELFVMGRREFDREKRQAIYQEIHKRIYDDQPYTWIFYRPSLVAINKRIQGVQFSPRGIYSFDPGFYAWWVAEAQ